MIDWDNINTVLLDMDGTLLDLHYDNYFWLEYLPEKWAEQQGLPVMQARAALLAKVRSKQGSLLWYCVDYWSDELQLDIMQLKADIEHKINPRPHAIGFLQKLSAQGKALVMVTNAHRKLIAVKFAKVGIGRYFDRVISAHDLGYPKEEQRFWELFSEHHQFHTEHTVFIDDNFAVLRSARQFGLKHLLAIARPDSQGPLLQHDEFHCIDSFDELI